MNVVTMSAIIVTLFLGGPSGPLPTGDFFGSGLLRALLPTAYFFIKLLLFLFTFVWFRGTLPRFRYDQLMDLGWKVLIPLSLGWFLLLVGVKLGDQNGWPVWATVVGGLAGIGIFGGLLSAAVRVAKLRQREEVAG
jgi:NADH-quinone oxidoreductase subunit H